MNDRCYELIDVTARVLAGKVLTQEELQGILFTLVRTCYLPERLAMVQVRRSPVAGEILPPQQRATWARATTVYDR